MKQEWRLTRKEVWTGLTVNAYESEDGRWIVESRKRDIPHANGSGYWQHTTYFLIDKRTGVEKEFQRRKDAIIEAEGEEE